MLIEVLGNERDESKLQLAKFHPKSLTEESEILYTWPREHDHIIMHQKKMELACSYA